MYVMTTMTKKARKKKRLFFQSVLMLLCVMTTAELCDTGRSPSLDRSSPDIAPPPAKRQQINPAAGGGATGVSRNQRTSRGGPASSGSWPPPTTTGNDTLPSKFTQTDFPDPSTLAESLPMLIELKGDLRALVVCWLLSRICFIRL